MIIGAFDSFEKSTDEHINEIPWSPDLLEIYK